MDVSEKMNQVEKVVEEALPISHYEILLTKFLDFKADELGNNLVLNQVTIFICLNLTLI